MMYRKSSQRIQRPYAQADGQQFHITRSRPVQGSRGVAHIPDPAFWRKAACKEVNCTHWERGWQTTLDLTPNQPAGELGLNRARYNYIRDKSGRSFREEWVGSTVTFLFPAGQTCFREHRVPLARDPRFLHLPGPGRETRQVDYDEFFDRFNETSHILEQRAQGG